MIPTVEQLDASVLGLVRDRLGGLSKGGMASKLEAARLATTGGENVIIASGRSPDVLPRIIAGEPVGTLFLAQGQTVAARKRWIGLTVKPRGRLILDAGARAAVEQKGRSLLAAGVVEVEGQFHKGDVVALRGPDGVEFARGLTNYSADEVRRIKGLKTAPDRRGSGPLPLRRNHPSRQHGRHRASLIDMHHLGRREAVEPGRRGVAVGADVLAVDVVAQVEFGQFLGQRDRVQRVAGRAEDRADLRRPLLERLEVVLAVVEDDAGEGVVDAVVEVVAAFAVAAGLADHLGDGRAGGGHEEPARLGQNLDVLAGTAGPTRR